MRPESEGYAWWPAADTSGAIGRGAQFVALSTSGSEPRMLIRIAGSFH
jgi:hypothetical protein